jgi:hypothetical protein
VALGPRPNSAVRLPPADTTILGLGELEIVGKEHKQPSGGRIDFLIHHADTDLNYGVEITLGNLDESHIIRAIEYWDIERQRRPQSDHRAVIVAENITSRSSMCCDF